MHLLTNNQDIFQIAFLYCKRGNPLIKHITGISYEFADVTPDYVIGKTSCILFLSLRYHQLNPDYVHERLKILGSSYNLRVLLVQVMALLTYDGPLIWLLLQKLVLNSASQKFDG